jgi:hypothetical protein
MSYQLQIIIKIGLIVFIFCLLASFYLYTKNINGEKIFYNIKWVSFYGRINSKHWVHHNIVNNVAKKFLQLNTISPVKIEKKVMFPFSILFVSSKGNESIIWFNTKYFSFDKKRIFLHNLAGDDVEAFYRIVH